jgi:LysR family transcriptional regulator, regulator for bpeEF and oprC
MDALAGMRAFVRIVENNSFTRAADDLNVSRASVTTALARLEARLGVRLLARTTRRLSLTEEGRTYYEACVRILGDLQEAEDSLSSARAVPRGRLRVTLSHAYAQLVLFPALQQFFERYPALELEAVVTDRAVNLVEEGIDCAVRAMVLGDDAGLVARRVSEIRWITCAAPAYLARHPAVRTVEDLSAHNCIAFLSPGSGRTINWSFVVDGKPQSFVPQGNLRVTSLDAAASAAAAGVGIAQVPEPMIFAAVREKRLEPLLLETAAPAPSVYVVYPRNRYLSAKVRAFIDFIVSIDPAREAELRLP